MDCSYCKKDMGNSDICPSCGMGKRASEETPEKVKEESSIPRTTRHNENHDILPSKESTSQKVVGFGIVMAIVIGLGILTGALLRAGSP
jgi:hypothetical protein